MKIKKTFIKDLLIIHLNQFSDKRGFFQEQYSYRYYKDSILKNKFVQDNLTFSKKNVLRGLHFQVHKPQAKLISVIYGKIFDVAVDLRPKSKTYLKYFSIILSNKNNKQLFIPKGFAHGFFVLSEFAYVNYKCSDYYDSTDDNGIIWNDKKINIKWPLRNNIPIISKKDKKLNKLS